MHTLRLRVLHYVTGVLAATLGMARSVPQPVPVAPEPETPEEARYYARMYDSMATLLEDVEARGHVVAEQAEAFLREHPEA